MRRAFLISFLTVCAISPGAAQSVAAPVLPFPPNRASAGLPGTIGLTPELFAAINEQVADELVKTGFKNVVLSTTRYGRSSSCSV